MKVRLEFEREDLEHMLTQYFERDGFRVKNLDELCEQFEQVYPEGLQVQAEIIQDTKYEAGAIPEAPEKPGAEIVIVEESAIDLGGTRGEAPAPLSYTDLLDPTQKVPRRDDEDVIDLVRRSKQLEAERRR